MAETPRQSRAPPAFVLSFDSRRIHDGFIVPHCFLRVKRAAGAVPRQTTLFTTHRWSRSFQAAADPVNSWNWTQLLGVFDNTAPLG